MAVMREESFGPVVGIMKVHDDEEAIALMNDSPYGLTASIWTSDIDRAAEHRCADRDRHGVHEPLRLSRPGLAWTGVKDTGRGVVALEVRLRGAHPAQELPSPVDHRVTT